MLVGNQEQDFGLLSSWWLSEKNTADKTMM